MLTAQELTFYCTPHTIQAAENGHKSLVFSSFTTMLELLQAEAERRGLHTLYLSGRDGKEKRREMVEAFRQGAYDVFFISLKAGGTGLTLTAADEVIHFDPWWNAAAEQQASDRSHRIGQKNTVFVTKLVARKQWLTDVQQSPGTWRKTDMS